LSLTLHPGGKACPVDINFFRLHIFEKMQKELDNMLQKFPGYRAKIIALFSCNDDFKSLCDDYLQCRISLQKFRDNKLEDIRAETEYKRLCVELEEDALRLLAAKE